MTMSGLFKRLGAAIALSLWAAPAAGLVDHRGDAVGDEVFRGHYQLVYFGYTFCPDVCPTSLIVMIEALERLGPAAEAVRPMFVTVDPTRDTPAVLADFVPAIHPRLVALTGTAEEMAALAARHGIAVERHATGDGEHYLIDHTSKFLLIGPDGRTLAAFPHGIRADHLARALEAWVGQKE